MQCASGLSLDQGVLKCNEFIYICVILNRFMKNVPYVIVLFFFLLSACNRQVDQKPEEGPAGLSRIKIEIVSGNNQWDTIGQRLNDSIVIRLTRRDTILKNYPLLFTDSSCQVTTLTNKQTSDVGLSVYSWQLNATNGKQNLKVSVYDSVLNIKDSIFVTAEGIVPDSTWLPGNCLPGIGETITTLAQLSTGRIYCGTNLDSAPFYSDDNGQSWQRLDLYPYKYFIEKICISPSDEIYVATRHNGIFYSADKGQTWESRSNGLTSTQYLSDLTILKNGKLLTATDYGGIFLSHDKGRNWIPISGTLRYQYQFYNLCESAGILYAISQGDDLWKSMDYGTTWNRVSYSAFTKVQSLFIDSVGTMYVGTEGVDGYIYRSTDNGINWVKIFTNPEVTGIADRISNFSMKNGHFYFTSEGYGLVRTKDFIKYDKISFATQAYLVAHSGTVLLNCCFKGLFYNHNP